MWITGRIKMLYLSSITVWCHVMKDVEPFVAHPSLLGMSRISMNRVEDSAKDNCNRLMMFGRCGINDRSWVLGMQPIDEYEEYDEEGEEDQTAPTLPIDFDDDDLPSFTRDEMAQQFTVTQLRQQLRLRGKKVSGNKSQLINRILGSRDGDRMDDTEEDAEVVDGVEDGDGRLPPPGVSKARAFAESKGKELIDVSDYLDEQDQGKEYKTAPIGSTVLPTDTSTDTDDEPSSSSSPETWGEEARIIEDYEGRAVVIDSLSRTQITFEGAEKDAVRAYVVATRDSLRGYLAGGNRTVSTADAKNITAEVQMRKEREARVPVRSEDDQGLDQDDEEGHYTNVLTRDYGDWGDISTTGVQLSSREVKGVLLLSDLYGPFTEHTRALADKIAFECQPVVVFLPDMFRGDPWIQDETITDQRLDGKGRTYEQWRTTHSDQRVSVDIRAAAAALRKQYDVSSVSLFGTCYGGGRALEVAARVYPNNTLDCESGMEGPPHVDPMACVAWYPTMYEPEKLFGPNNKSMKQPQQPDDGTDPDRIVDPEADQNEPLLETAVMAVFAGEDTIPGATTKDAEQLKACLENDDRVKDSMVKVFPNEQHGFAHQNLATEHQAVDEFIEGEFGGVPTNAMDNGSAEVAYLLSTAWIETYSRVFLPTIGPRVTDDEYWSQDLSIPDLSYADERDIRAEIDEAIRNQPDVEPDFRRMHPDDFRTPIEDMEDMNEQELYNPDALENTVPYGLSVDDDADTIMEKIKDAIDRDDLAWLPGAGKIPLDGSGEGYW